MSESTGNTDQRLSTVEKSVQAMGDTLNQILKQLQMTSQTTDEKIQAEDAKIQSDERILGEAADAFSQMNAALQSEEVDIQKTQTRLEANERATSDVINEVLHDEAQLTETFRRYDARLDALTAALANQENQALNGKSQNNTDKLDKLLAIKRNLPTLIIDANDVRLLRTSKQYHDVSLKFPPEFQLTIDSDYAAQLLMIQNTLLAKDVLFQDWGIYLANLCSVELAGRLLSTRGNPIPWVEAVTRLLGNTNYFMRSVNYMAKLHAMVPTQGQNLHEFFKTVFALAYKVTEFSVLPCLCTRIALAIQFDHPLVFPTKFIDTIKSVYDFEQFIYDSIPSSVIYHGPPSGFTTNSNAASLFALAAPAPARKSVADSYFCSNCSCPKCSGSHKHLKAGFCVNCHCTKCTTRSKNFSSNRKSPHFKINQISNAVNATALSASEEDNDDYTDIDFPDEEMIHFYSDEDSSAIPSTNVISDPAVVNISEIAIDDVLEVPKLILDTGADLNFTYANLWIPGQTLQLGRIEISAGPIRDIKSITATAAFGVAKEVTQQIELTISFAEGFSVSDWFYILPGSRISTYFGKPLLRQLQYSLSMTSETITVNGVVFPLQEFPEFSTSSVGCFKISATKFFSDLKIRFPYRIHSRVAKNTYKLITMDGKINAPTYNASKLRPGYSYDGSPIRSAAEYTRVYSDKERKYYIKTLEDLEQFVQ